MDLEKVPPYARAEVERLEAQVAAMEADGRRGMSVGMCQWCHRPFIRYKPWGKYCQDKCRVERFGAYNPRVIDKAAGRRAQAKAILEAAGGEE